MKLIICRLAARNQYINRESPQIIEELVSKHGWRHIEPSRLGGPGSFKSRLLRETGRLPHLVLFWEEYGLLADHFRELSDMWCRKWIFADDLHSWSESMRTAKTIAFAVSDLILATCAYKFKEFYPQLAQVKKVKWVPHSACRDFMVTYNPSAQNAILLSGAIDRHYPLRQRMLELYKLGGYPIRLHPHPGYHCGYDHRVDRSVGQGYASRINQHRAAFTDSSIYRYIVRKYFEIPATGALLIADKSISGPFRELGFIENVHYIAVSPENLEEKIQYVLDEGNHQELDQIRRRGQELVWQKHKVEDRANLIDGWCN
jgi:hypothetical protein